MTKPHVTHNSKNNEWYTPAYLVEAARKVMGTIDLDPASSAKANETVQASRYYDLEVDGLTQVWYGKVWLNPPYSRDLLPQFIEAFLAKRSAGEFTEGMVLVNNATETKWFQQLIKRASAVCFLSKRVKFLDESGNPKNTPLQGQVVLYFGTETTEFAYQFDRFGWVGFTV